MAKKIKVRKFKKGDEYDVARIIRRAIQVTNKKYYSPAVIKFLCSGASAVKILKKSKERNYKVAVLGNKIVGVICLTENENRIRQFFVDPLHQGKGVGRELINFIEKEAKKLKLKYLQVHSSLFAVLFYKHFGYKKIRKLIIHKNNGPKFETILMKKAL